MSSPDDIKLAEDIGYERAWLYDTPQQSPDVWVSLALAAPEDLRIGLGPGVLVPHLRHPMTNAAATATLAALAPDGWLSPSGPASPAGRAMGYRAIPWSYMTAYLDAYCGLLRGEIVEWEGVAMQMLHPDGSGPARPIDVPILIGALGPKGRAVAAAYDGIFVTNPFEGLEPGQFDRVAFLWWGTVTEPGEDLTSERVKTAAGPGGALAYHATYELYGLDAVGGLPGGAEWIASVSASEPRVRHLDVHRGHLIHMNEADDAAWAVTGGSLLPATTLTGTPDEVKARVDDLGERGVTEIVYQPIGPDIRRELEAMYSALSR